MTEAVGRQWSQCGIGDSQRFALHVCNLCILLGALSVQIPCSGGRSVHEEDCVFLGVLQQVLPQGVFAQKAAEGSGNVVGADDGLHVFGLRKLKDRPTDVPEDTSAGARAIPVGQYGFL